MQYELPRPPGAGESPAAEPVSRNTVAPLDLRRSDVVELAERLRPVCAGWDEARFVALVCRIAELKRRWTERYDTEQRPRPNWRE